MRSWLLVLCCITSGLLGGALSPVVALAYQNYFVNSVLFQDGNNGETCFTLAQREQFPYFPVATFKPCTTKVMTVDLFPKGLPAESDSGYTYIHMCDRDMFASANNGKVACLGFHAFSDLHWIGPTSLFGAATKPLVIGNQWEPSLVIWPDGSVDVLGEFRTGQAALDHMAAMGLSPDAPQGTARKSFGYVQP